MERILNFEPKEVFYYFEEISRLPRPSYKEDRASEYVINFAKERGLEYYTDEAKNVIVIKEATKGYEDVAPIILQGHLDMVCEKDPDYEIDFEKDGLELEVNGDYISAKGTTLGGDDGIAVAYALALLDSKEIEHPRLEVILTTAEEVGMDGAAAIDLSMLKGNKMINLDSEEEGEMLVSCAGGCTAKETLPVKREEISGMEIQVTVGGLKGGHSGAEIDKGRANSNMLMARVLAKAVEQEEFYLETLAGGTKDNAIPRETKAVLLAEENCAEKIASIIEEEGAKAAAEYAVADPDIQVKAIVKASKTAKVVTKEDTKKFLIMLNVLPNGIIRMSDNIKGLVETSLNLGILTLEDDAAVMKFSVRSSVESAKEDVAGRLSSIVTFMGGSSSITGNYPSWEYKKESVLREDMMRVYKEMYGKDAVVQAIHAGLECGILGKKIKDLDCVSIGPNMMDIHTTQEQLSISSTKRVWEYLLEVLKCK